MIVAAAALAVLPKSDAVFERQQLGSNLRLRKDHADAVATPGFTIEPSCDAMKEIIKSQEETITSQAKDIASLKAMLHQMKDELADERRRLTHIDTDGLLLPCLPSAMVSMKFYFCYLVCVSLPITAHILSHSLTYTAICTAICTAE